MNRVTKLSNTKEDKLMKSYYTQLWEFSIFLVEQKISLSSNLQKHIFKKSIKIIMN